MLERTFIIKIAILPFKFEPSDKITSKFPLTLAVELLVIFNKPDIEPEEIEPIEELINTLNEANISKSNNLKK